MTTEARQRTYYVRAQHLLHSPSHARPSPAQSTLHPNAIGTRTTNFTNPLVFLFMKKFFSMCVVAASNCSTSHAKISGCLLTIAPMFSRVTPTDAKYANDASIRSMFGTSHTFWLRQYPCARHPNALATTVSARSSSSSPNISLTTSVAARHAAMSSGAVGALAAAEDDDDDDDDDARERNVDDDWRRCAATVGAYRGVALGIVARDIIVCGFESGRVNE
jgi:hypothetical protein